MTTYNFMVFENINW